MIERLGGEWIGFNDRPYPALPCPCSRGAGGAVAAAGFMRTVGLTGGSRNFRKLAGAETAGEPAGGDAHGVTGLNIGGWPKGQKFKV